MIAAFALFAAPILTDFRPALYYPQPAVTRRADLMDSPWPIQEVGTGGIALGDFILNSCGYQPFTIIESSTVEQQAPHAKLMQQVKAGFGRTMSRLPEVFGVSRQTLYNWLEGETPKEKYRGRLFQLSQAAGVFAELGVIPNAIMLDRTVAEGKTFLQLMAAGADGKETAKKLIRIVQRGRETQAKLDALLAGRKAKLDASDIWSRSLDENA